MGKKNVDLDPVSDSTFLGFVADDGEAIASLRFFSLFDGTGREAFGADNFVGVTANVIPEPGCALLTGIAILGCISRRKR